MFDKTQTIAAIDPQLSAAMLAERQRQESHVELIASENFTSPAVLEAQGSVLTNKYAEGYPTARYYGGCQYVDEVESLAISRAKKLFGADFANVCPAPFRLTGKSDRLFRPIKAGGYYFRYVHRARRHLTHGAKVNLSGKIFNAVGYGLHPELRILTMKRRKNWRKNTNPKWSCVGHRLFPDA